MKSRGEAKGVNWGGKGDGEGREMSHLLLLLLGNWRAVAPPLEPQLASAGTCWSG